MRLTQIRHFLAIAQHRSLRAAAKEIGIAQPSLTKSIQALEQELGAPLFERTSRGATLTPIGELFRTRTRSVVEDIRRAKEEIQQLTDAPAGEVTVAMTTAPILLFLSRALSGFAQRFSGVSVHIAGGGFPSYANDLLEGRIDFAVVPQPAGELGDDLAVEHLVLNPRIPICRQSHPMAEAGSLGLLLDETWLSTTIDPDPRKTFEATFRAHGFAPPRRVVFCEAPMAICELLMKSDAICWLPSAWLESDLVSAWATRIPVAEHYPQEQDICLIRRRHLPLTPAAEHLATLIRRLCAYRGGMGPAAEDLRSR